MNDMQEYGEIIDFFRKSIPPGWEVGFKSGRVVFWPPKTIGAEKIRLMREIKNLKRKFVRECIRKVRDGSFLEKLIGKFYLFFLQR